MFYLRSLAIVVLCALSAVAQSLPSNPKAAAMSFCDLAKDPYRYDHQHVRVTAFITHAFEDFSLSAPDCPGPPVDFHVWITFGGRASSQTVYCCPGEGTHQPRANPIVIEGVGLALADDDNFRRFNRVLTDEKDTTIHGTFEGTFFVGHVKDATGRESGGGYGHMGCCSLFVLQSVDDFDPHTRKDVDYTAEAGYYENPVCKASASRTLKYVSVTYSLTDAQQAIADQQLADNGSRAWAFHDPDRVAAESIASLYPPPLPQLHKVKSTAAREVLDASWGKKRTVVVLTRPYWLSFYAVSGTVAWTATKVEEFDCR